MGTANGEKKEHDFFNVLNLIGYKFLIIFYKNSSDSSADCKANQSYVNALILMLLFL